MPVSQRRGDLYATLIALLSDCNTGGMYTSPTAGQTVDSSKPVTISWNPTCLTPTNGQVDIYLYAPSAAQPRIHVWRSVPHAPGKFTAEIKPKWWKSTSSIGLQFAVVASDVPDFDTIMPAGPIFTATYTAPTDGSTPANADISKPEAGITNVGALGSKKLAPGGVAAAVLVPLLILIALGAAWWIRKSRLKGREKRKLWSEAVDKRMSTISTDWKSVTAGGAKEAIRQSMAISGNNRMSGFAFGTIRPQSTASELGMGQAGIGARGGYGLYQHENESFNPEFAPPMSQLRPGLRTSAFSTERISRVSFANDPRPKSRYNEKSVYGDAPVPRLPRMNADQTRGPLSLTAEDIRARLQGTDQGRSSMDEVIPALSSSSNVHFCSVTTDSIFPLYPSDAYWRRRLKRCRERRLPSLGSAHLTASPHPRSDTRPDLDRHDVGYACERHVPRRHAARLCRPFAVACCAHFPATRGQVCEQEHEAAVWPRRSPRREGHGRRWAER
jgi:hypothetical protein